MFDDWDIRVQASALIWMAFAIISVVVLVADDTPSNDIPIIFIAGLAAFLSSSAVWLFAQGEQDAKKIAQMIMAKNNDHEKPKRHESNDPRMDVLLGLMSDEEKESLKHRLQDELYMDGQDVPLSALIDDEGELRRRVR